MGQAFSEPVTEKESSTERNENFLVASSSIQGWRISMEDAHTILLSMPDDPNASFFAVFDGHGGAKVANYASENLHQGLCSNSHYKNGDIVEALKSSFIEFDEMMFNDEKMRDELAGSTAVVIVVKDSKIYCANIGDSRAVASIGGQVDPLSIDHKPTCEEEMNRIVSAGGWVQFNRVNGNLALSRAFGDFVFKRNDKRSATEQIVTAYPDVQIRPLTSDLEFIIMACDGVWDVMTNEEVVEFIRRRIFYKCEPVAICEELITRCLAPDCQMGCGIGCDNMTVILICYLNGQTYEEYCNRVTNGFMLPYQRHIVGPVKHSSEEDNDDSDNSSESQIESTKEIIKVNNNKIIDNEKIILPTSNIQIKSTTSKTDIQTTTVTTSNSSQLSVLSPVTSDTDTGNIANKSVLENENEQQCDNKSKEIIVESLLSEQPSPLAQQKKANIDSNNDALNDPNDEKKSLETIKINDNDPNPQPLPPPLSSSSLNSKDSNDNDDTHVVVIPCSTPTTLE